MEKKRDNKKRVRFFIPRIIIAFISMVMVCACGKEDGYRLIQVYEVNGEATIERPEIGSMDAYENLNLVSGDKVTTMLESYTRLKLDEDKYLLAEEDSIVELVATGDEKNSKTSINLLQGAVTIEVQNKLNSDSTFEVTTPNSVMAVRGTVFRIQVDVDEAGKPITRITVFEGAVGVQKKDENGNLTEEQVIPSSKEALVYFENEEEILVILDEIDIADIPLEVLDFLKEIVEERREIAVPLEDIKEAIENIKQEESTEDTTEDSTEDSTEENTEEDIEEDIEDTGNQEDGSAENERPSNTENEQQGSTEEQEQKVFTVQFTYNGTLFGTQQVKEGELVAKPKLMPALSGHWDFDFTTPITEDTEIKFVE